MPVEVIQYPPPGDPNGEAVTHTYESYEAPPLAEADRDWDALTTTLAVATVGFVGVMEAIGANNTSDVVFVYMFAELAGPFYKSLVRISQAN